MTWTVSEAVCWVWRLLPLYQRQEGPAVLARCMCSGRISPVRANHWTLFKYVATGWLPIMITPYRQSWCRVAHSTTLKLNIDEDVAWCWSECSMRSLPGAPLLKKQSGKMRNCCCFVCFADFVLFLFRALILSKRLRSFDDAWPDASRTRVYVPGSADTEMMPVTEGQRSFHKLPQDIHLIKISTCPSSYPRSQSLCFEQEQSDDKRHSWFIIWRSVICSCV